MLILKFLSQDVVCQSGKVLHIWGECGMGSLLELLKRASEIPKEELRISKNDPEGRVTEMALLSEVISLEKIKQIRTEKGYCISRAFDKTGTRITFQVTNGTVHTVVISTIGDKLRVVDNRNILDIETVEGLRAHLLNLAGIGH